MSGLVLLLGAPGVGKSTLASALLAAHSSSIHAFLNVGEHLRAEGRLDAHLRCPSAARKLDLRRLAQGMLEDACRDLLASSSRPTHSSMPRVLLVEAVKELDDAYTLMEVLEQYKLPLLQVLYLQNAHGEINEYMQSYLEAAHYAGMISQPEVSTSRDAARLVQQRLQKWQVNEAALIEFFSATGVLVEVAAWPRPQQGGSHACVSINKGQGGTPASSTGEGAAGSPAGSQSGIHAPKGTLAALGYARSSSSMWLVQAGWCCNTTHELRAVAWCQSLRARQSYRRRDLVNSSLVATAIEPVVSTRLVTARAERASVLALAAASTGLFNGSCSTGNHSSSSSSSSDFQRIIAVPSQSVASAADARWLAVPGRYKVSAKLDGTRHLLIATGSQDCCYLLSRSGMLYKYPCSVMPGQPASCSIDAGDTGTSGNSGSSSSTSVGGSSVCTGTSISKARSGGTSNISAGAGGTSTHANTSSTSSSGCSSRSGMRHGGHLSQGLLAPPLPAGTVLDGELLWLPESSAKRGFFVAFDALSIGSSRAWQLPLPERLQRLQDYLRLPDYRSLKINSPAAAEAKSPTATGSSGARASTGSGGSTSEGARGSQTTPQQPSDWARPVSKKQQAAPPGQDMLQLLLKLPMDVTAASLKQLEAEAAGLPLPTDGLVFTPTALPYALGMSQLLFKWQPWQQAAADIFAKELPARWDMYSIQLLLQAAGATNQRDAAMKVMDIVEQLPQGLVLECLPVLPQLPADAAQRLRDNYSKNKRVFWLPQSVRWDKATGNSIGSRQQLEQHITQPSSTVTLAQLLQAVAEVEAALGLRTSQLTGAAQASSNAASGRTAAHNTGVAASSEAGELTAAAAGGRRGGAGSNVAAGALPASTAAAPGTNPAIDPAGAAGSYHPAKGLACVKLYASVMQQVETGAVQVTTDAGTGLQVFCYDMSRGVPGNPVAAMCRGLVLHAATSCTVATPFVRFGGLDTGPPNLFNTPQSGPAASISGSHGASSSTGTFGRGRDRRGRGRRGRVPVCLGRVSIHEATRLDAERAKEEEAQTAAAANLQLYRCWDQQHEGSASVKLDGSFIIAFMWQGQLRTTTRRRMDSEQAIWAAAWLQEHASLEAFKPGWTYMFEAVYADNTHVVRYPFEGCVLLGAVSPAGAELSAAGRQQLAQQLGVMAVPTISGQLPELVGRLGHGCDGLPGTKGSTSPASSSSSSSSVRPGVQHSTGSSSKEANENTANATFEGWVLQDHSSGCRYKLVQKAFQHASRAASYMLHPLVVWDAVFCGKSHAELTAGLPPLFATEMSAILVALDRRFVAVKDQLRVDLQNAWLPATANAGAACQSPSCIGRSSSGQCTTSGVFNTSSRPPVAATAAAAPAGCTEADEPQSASIPNKYGLQQLQGSMSGLRLDSAALCTPNSPSVGGVTSQLLAGDCPKPAIDRCGISGISNISGSSGSSSSIGSSSGTDMLACVFESPQYAAALKYAASKGTAWVRSMFLRAGERSPSASTVMVAPALRGLILECIRPAVDGSLPGYLPSAAFQQTYAKGWARGPQEGRVSVLSPPSLILQLTDEVQAAVLSKLQGRDIGRALLVCRAWSQLLQEDARFKEQAARHATRPMAASISPLSRSSGSTFGCRHSYWSDDDLYSDYGGYGSP